MGGRVELLWNPVLQSSGGMVTDSRKMTVLSPYMEVVGTFAELVEEDGMLLAEIAGHVVVLPIGLKDKLAPNVGSRIAILRTDIPGKEYMIRVLTGRDERVDDSRGMCCTTIVIPHAAKSEGGSIC
ncbi:MAG: hypothetical protein N3G75_02535 [Methanothrix sp.]|nr:hypothetical protein [Methanothrix sp.]MCX8206693.1 hypothetical protein [Methanothrix sp.]